MLYDQYQELLQNDEEYRLLEGKQREAASLLRPVLLSLPAAEKEIITQYIGICAEMELRAMELVCVQFFAVDKTTWDGSTVCREFIDR